MSRMSRVFCLSTHSNTTSKHTFCTTLYDSRFLLFHVLFYDKNKQTKVTGGGLGQVSKHDVFRALELCQRPPRVSDDVACRDLREEQQQNSTFVVITFSAPASSPTVSITQL